MIRYLIFAFFFLICSATGQSLTQGASDQSLFITVVAVSAFFIISNGFILISICCERRKYKVNLSLTRFLFYQQISQIMFEPRFDPSRNCCSDENETLPPFSSRNCFRQKDILTEIPCFIIHDQPDCPSTKVIVNCIRCEKPTRNILISQFGQTKLSIAHCFFIPFFVIWPALLYGFCNKHILWSGYFCECGLEKQVIDISTD